MNKLAVTRVELKQTYKETMLFDALFNFDVRFIGFSVCKEWLFNPRFVYLNVKKFLPDFICNSVTRRPYSTVSPLGLQDLEDALKKIDIIESIELYSFLSCQCAKIAKKHGKKLVISIFETISSPLLHKLPPFLRNVKTCLRQADAFIAYTNRSAEYLQQLSAPREKIKVIYPGIDLKKFHPPKKRDHSNLRILFVGGLAGEKGIDILLKAFSKLYRKNSQTELWICAKPRHDKEEALIQFYSQKYPVKAFGHVDHEKLPEIYRRCDIFCLPSFDKRKFGVTVWEEQFGFVLVEAMASGLPIVATRCGAIPEIMGPNNILVPQESEKTLFSALSTLINDSTLRVSMSKMSRQRAEQKFDIIKQRKKMNETLISIL